MDNVPKVISDIYQVFIDYYEEPNVDLQVISSDNIIDIDPCGQQNGDFIILVHWNTVTITNEYDESIEIWDLYSANIITPTGKLRRAPAFVRSTYDETQWASSYCHSHIMSIHKPSCQQFRYSCLGTGPIRTTIDSLKINTIDLDMWKLYCWELDKYVHVESLSGGPYRRLHDVGKNLRESHKSAFEINCIHPYGYSRMCKDLTKKLLDLILKSNILKYSFDNGRYLIGMPFHEAVLAISNLFIEWHNSDPEIYKKYPKNALLAEGFMEKAFLVGGYIVSSTDQSPDEAFPSGKELFYFKGKMVTLRRLEEEYEYNEGEITIINLGILNYIVYKILVYLNVNYGKSTDNSSKETRII